jgi:cell division protein FtsN
LFKKQQTDTPNAGQPEINKASLLPPMKSANTISKETLNEKIVENTEDLTEKVDLEKPVVAEPVQETPEEMPEVKATEKIIEISPVKVQQHFSYFLIAGSFNSEANARKLVAELRNKGFQAEIADTNKYGMYRVAYEGFETETEALQRLQVIKSQNNPEAWLLKK